MDKQKKITQKNYIETTKQFEPYIRETDIRLKTDEYIILHFDGVGMTHSHLSKMNNNVKKTFDECLLNVTKHICEYFKGARLAYVCNDEISLLLEGSEVENNYHNRIQKLISIAAAKASTELVLQLKLTNNKHFDNLISNCLFAVKCYNLPSNLVNEYFKSRLLSCKKSIFDHREKFESQPEWKKFGHLLTYSETGWKDKCIDFENNKLIKSPQNRYYSIK